MITIPSLRPILHSEVLSSLTEHVLLRQLSVDIVLLVWRQLFYDVDCYAIIIRH